MRDDELTEIVEGRIWAWERPIWFSGVRLRARTSVLRLEDGRLLVYSPAPPSPERIRALGALGEVAWLVVPNGFHHLGTPAAAAAFPKAKVLAPASAAAHAPGLRIDLDVRDPAFERDVPELARLPLEGVPFLDETLFHHRPTKTLFVADAVLRADPKDHWTWRFAARVTGCFERVRVPPDVRKKIDREAAARSLRALEGLPVERLVMAHGDVLTGEPVAQLLAAWRLEGVG